MVSCDLLDMEPVTGAVILPGRDFTAASTWREIRAAVSGREVRAVLSDMAPNVSGNPELDHEAITNLVYTVLKFRKDNAMHLSTGFDLETCVNSKLIVD